MGIDEDHELLTTVLDAYAEITQEYDGDFTVTEPWRPIDAATNLYQRPGTYRNVPDRERVTRNLCTRFIDTDDGYDVKISALLTGQPDNELHTGTTEQVYIADADGQEDEVYDAVWDVWEEAAAMDVADLTPV